MKHFIAILTLACSAGAGQNGSIVISGGGQSIAVSGSAANSVVPPAAQAAPPSPMPQNDTEPFQVVPTPPPKFVEPPPAAKPSPPAPAVVPAVVRRVTQRFLIVTSGCPACPAAKAAFERAGNPRENIISPSEAMRRFGVSTSYVPYEFTAQVDVQSQVSRPVQSVPVQRQRLPVVQTQWGRIDLETYNRNCSCPMCRGIRQLQAQYRQMAITPEPETDHPGQEPTPAETITQMVDLLRLNSSDVLADLGCGDGRILIAAVRKYGCRGVGVEIDADQARRARMAVDAAGLSERITIVTGDVLDVDLQSHGITAITAYLFPHLLEKLAPRIQFARVVASPFHQIPGLAMTQNGDVWVWRKEAVSEIPGFNRADEINHLMDPATQHGGRFSRANLERMTDWQLIDIHNREHGVNTINGVRS